MLLVVTGIGSLIHIYAIGYMAHEGGYYRFFAYLNLFMFFMLTLVLAANFLLLFVGWEGVGLVQLSADRLLFRQEVRHRRRQQGVHRESHRRFRLLAGDVPDLRELSSRWISPRVFQHAPGKPEATLTTIGLLLDGGRLRQVRAASALRLAARRHGRSHAGIRADPRGDHGHGRRLHDGALVGHLHARAGRDEGDRDHRSRYGVLRRHHRPGPERISRRFSPTPRCRSSATCSSAWAPALSPRVSTTWSRTRSSRLCSSSARAA